MSIPTQAKVWQYNGNDLTTLFDYGQPIQDASWLKLTKIKTDGTSEELTSNYTVQGVGSSSSATWKVLYPNTGSPLATGEKLYITLQIPLTQETEIGQQEGYDPEEVEDSLDKLTLITLGLQEQIDRKIGVGIGETDVTPDAYLEMLQDSVVAAQLAETNAETAKTAAELAETNAETAQAAAATSASNAAASASSILSVIRTRLTTALTIYVATTGNDTTGTGLVGAPYATIQKAVDVLYKNYDMAGYAVTISVAAGTYAAGATLSGRATGQLLTSDITIQGNGACNISQTTTADAFKLQGGARARVAGFTISSTTNSNAFVAIDTGTVLTLGSGITFGATGTANHILANYGAVVYANGISITITGAAGRHAYASNNAVINIVGNSYTITGTPAFSLSFVSADTMGNILGNGSTFSGSATGQRYAQNGLSLIWTSSGGASYFPGNSAGASSNGAVYV